MLYNVVLVSAVQQSESVIYPLSFGFPSHLGHHRALSRVPVLYSRFSLVMYLMHSINNVYIYMSIQISQFAPVPFPHLVPTHLFSTPMSLLLLCRQVHLYHFSKFHIYTLIYGICFSLSDISLCVTSLGPPWKVLTIIFFSVLFHKIFFECLLCARQHSRFMDHICP